MQDSEPVKPTLTGIFFAKNGQIITRPLTKSGTSITIPMNVGDTRLFMKDGCVTTPFAKLTFEHVQDLPVAGFTIAVYQETAAAEFDPTDMAQVPVLSLEEEFNKLNPDIG